MLYGTCFSVKSQRPLIEAHCFGDCGKAIIGAIVDNQIGEIVPCRSETCPHLADELLFPGTVQGEEITLRKLK